MTAWSKDGLRIALDSKGWLIDSREIEHAIQFRLSNGISVNLYHTGSLSFGGRSGEFKSEVEEFVRAGPVDTIGSDAYNISGVKPRVFVVYGHDTDARDELELMLRRVQVEPIILENIPGVGETLIEKLESLTQADFACVLLTPDDVGASQRSPSDLRPRARQNVVLELGMVLSRLGRRRVAILVKGDDLEKPSDIAGLIYIPFRQRIGEVANALGAALATAGFDIDVRNLLGS